MNLTQFLRVFDVEQFSRWGVPFNSEEDALKVFHCFPSETFPERFGAVVLYDAYEDYSIYQKCQSKGIEPLCFGHWYSLLFVNSEQAKLAETRIREQLRTKAVGSNANQLVFRRELDEAAIYQAIASSEVEVIGHQVVVIPGIPDNDWTYLGAFCWLQREFKEDPLSSHPKILVRDLDAENIGIDRTVWIDACHEEEVIVQMIAWWLARSPVPDADWWGVIEKDGFPPRFDPEDWCDLAELSYVARMWEEHGEAFWVYYKAFRFDKKALPFESDKVQFMGSYSNVNDFFWNEYEQSCKEAGVEQNQEDFMGYCSMEQEFYTILRWQGDDYIYLIIP